MGSGRYGVKSTYSSWLSVNGPMEKGTVCSAEAEIILVTQGRPPRGFDFMLLARLDSVGPAAVCPTYPSITQKAPCRSSCLADGSKLDRGLDLDDGH